MVSKAGPPTTAEKSVTSGGLVLAAAVLWGTAGVASRWITEPGTLSALEIGFWRMALAAPLVLLAAWRLAGPPPTGVSRYHGLMLLMGLGLAGFQAGYFGAIAAVGVAIATLMAICTIPMMAALMAWVVFREPLTMLLTLALLIAAAGTVLIVVGAELPGLPGAAGLRSGIPLALGASFCFAVVTLAGRAMPANRSPLWTTAISLSVAAAALGVVVLASEAAWSGIDGRTWLILLWIALLPTALAYILFYKGVRGIRSGSAGLLILAEPLTANLLAWWLHGENLGPIGWLGAAMLLAAMLVAARDRTPGRRVTPINE